MNNYDFFLQEEIQQAQQIAQMHEDQAAEPAAAAPEEGGRRRSRAAANQAKQAMSRLNDPGDDIDYNPATPAPVQTFAVPGTKGRAGRTKGRASGSGTDTIY